MTIQQRPYKILVVDDNNLILELAEHMLSAKGYGVLKSANGDDVINLYNDKDPDVVLTDINMPGMSGYTLADKILEECPNQRIIMMTGDTSQKPKLEREGYPYLFKPFNVDKVYTLLDDLLSENTNGYDKI